MFISRDILKSLVTKWPTSLQQKLLDGILEILENFNYEKVAAVMRFLDWKYAGVDHTPTVQELKEYALQNIIDCINRSIKYNGRVTTLCGGFRVDVNTKDEPYIEVSFEIANWGYGD